MSSFEYYEYVTKDGDRWDMLAANYYGDPCKMDLIIRANPEVIIRPVLDAGIKIRIPVVEKRLIASVVSGEVPWRE